MHIFTYDRDIVMNNFPLRVGIHSGQQYSSFDGLASLWSAAEAAGFDWVSLFDHVRPPLGGHDGPCLDALTCLSALAARTERVRCGLMVAAPAWRHPGLLASAMTTIDLVSRGRAELGLGIGGGDLAYDQFGIRRPPAADRHEVLDEYCAVVVGLLRQPDFTFTGRHFQVAGARIEPRPVQLPLTIGASGERKGLRLVARWADNWNTIVVPPRLYAAKRAALDEWCAAEARDPATIRRSITFRTVLAATPSATRRRRDAYRSRLGAGHPDLAEHLDADSPEELVDLLGTYTDLGVSDLIVAFRPPLDLDTFDAIALEVLPRLRAQPHLPCLGGAITYV
jgi:alkanesulfonate monooxygenase SsuD/methylene tetrahydromethanopterin reductase-like flavin-dependent oxidoreductase (luciferase family)